jgi:hypothetical protein
MILIFIPNDKNSNLYKHSSNNDDNSNNNKNNNDDDNYNNDDDNNADGDDDGANLGLEQFVHSPDELSNVLRKLALLAIFDALLQMGQPSCERFIPH